MSRRSTFSLITRVSLALLAQLPAFSARAVAQGRVISVQPTATVVRTRSDVRVELVGQVLRYEVEERFTNRGARLGEADYLFPLPPGAAFQDLSLVINGELVSGETLPADEARRIYEEIVRRQRDPALVEWMGHGLLRTRIFPIAPGEEKRVVVRFQAPARREGDAVRVDHMPGNASSFTLVYPAGDRFGRAYSPTHQLDLVERGARREATVRGDASGVTMLVPVRQPTEASIATLAYAPGGEDGFALITVSPPAGADRPATASPRDVTLVLDISGSMSGVKMTQARAAARQLLETLSPRDRFRLVDFGTDVHTFRDAYSAVTPENLRAARTYIDQLEANGSTNIEGALREAVRPPVDPARLSLVLFITDGEPTIGERRPEALVELTRPYRGDPGRSPRRIFTFGVGAEVNASLLEQLALQGGGTSQFVRPEESVERAVSIVASRLVDPVLTDIVVTTETRDEGRGTEGRVMLSRMLPPRGTDLFAGQDLVVLARYKGHGPTRVVIEGRRGGAPVRWTQDVTLPDRDRANPFVARLWATQRVGYLSAERRRAGGASTEVDAEIRELGERYGIPTEFTSYFVREPMAPQPMPMGRVGRGGGGGGGSAGGGRGGGGAANAPPALATTGATFEAARIAAEQRAVTSLADVAADSSRNASVRVIDGRTFTRRDSAWVDNRFTAQLQTVSIKPYSRAWFDVIARLPELRGALALGDRVTIAGRSVALVVSPAGLDTLAARDLDAFIAKW